MSRVDRWSRFLTAVSIAVVILLGGLGLFRAGVIQDPGSALWPTYDLLSLDILQGNPPIIEMAFAFGVHVLIWTGILYGLLSLGRFVRRP
ncbi:MAG TPA: hypothetical protein VFW15_07280 [Thermoanaerobaculia bacterium]|nr:hypothetical protein [Thermoanaerobaculia bacterium]